MKTNRKDKSSIYKNAINSFDFDYTTVNLESSSNNNTESFKDANDSIDTSVTNTLQNVDYFA
jgi:hypothetical protein